MKTIEVAEATAPLAEYARANRRRLLLLTVRGRPYAALMPISTPTDLENLAVSNDPGFKVLIAESRRVNAPGTGLTTAQVRRALAGRRSRRSDK